MCLELFLYCIERLQDRPRRLLIHQPLDTPTKTSFTRRWATARFEAQQDSIIYLSPDHPDYGRGHLLDYNLEWAPSTDDPALWLLTITHTTNPTLSPREAILYASTQDRALPVTFSRAIFINTKTRMLGRDRTRASGAVYPALRPAVANTMWTTQGDQNLIRAWDMTTNITTEDS